MTLAELIKQREELDAKIAEVHKAEFAGAITKIKAMVAEFGLSAKDIFGKGNNAPKSGGASKTRVAPKYRDPSTGQTWTGRGKAPKWIDGKDRAQFAI